MTTAIFEYGKDSGFLRMDVRGHTGFAEMGKDPVCAGASVLAMTVAQCVENMHASGQLAKKPSVLVRNGRVSVTAKPKAEHFAEALHTFYVGEIGFTLLAKAYPNNVALTPFVIPKEG